MLLLPRHHRSAIGAAAKRAAALLLAVAGLARGDSTPPDYPPGPAPGPACAKIVYCRDGWSTDRDFATYTNETCEVACGGHCCVDGACGGEEGGRFSVCADDGDGSCTGHGACWNTGRFGNVGLISGGSCRGPYACESAGDRGGTIGDISCGSCRGEAACASVADYGGVIGDIVDSCRGEVACAALHAGNNESAYDPQDLHSCCNGDNECVQVDCLLVDYDCPDPPPPLPSTCALSHPICEAPDVYRSDSDDCERALTFEECKDAAKTLKYKWSKDPVPDSGKDIDHMPGGCFVKKNFNNGRIVKARFSNNGPAGTLCDTKPTKDKWSKECICGKFDDDGSGYDDGSGDGSGDGDYPVCDGREEYEYCDCDGDCLDTSFCECDEAIACCAANSTKH